MKYVIVLGDGMADYPVERLGGKTPLMAADAPTIKSLAPLGRQGLFHTIPDDMPTGSAVANLSVLGYDSHACYQGRGVLEAASMGVDLSETQVAMRCNLICISAGKIKNHSAGHITDEEAAILIGDLNQKLGDADTAFFPGVSYRHLLVMDGANPELTCYPPHDHVGEKVEDLKVKANSEEARITADRLNLLTENSWKILENHPINETRKSNGKDPANSVWFWSPGRKPAMKTLQDRYGISGAVISAVDLVKGLGVYAGMTVIEVPGATGLYTTNYEGKAEAAVEALKEHDLVYVHVEASDEAGHEMNLELKIKTIEYLDKRLIRIIWDQLKDKNIEAVIAVLPDHPTPVAHGKHVRDPVPVLIVDPRQSGDNLPKYDEESAKSGSLGTLHGADFIEAVLGKR